MNRRNTVLFAFLLLAIPAMAEATTGYYSTRILTHPGTTKVGDYPNSTGIRNNNGTDYPGVAYSTTGTNTQIFVDLQLTSGVLLEQLRIFGDDDSSLPNGVMTFYFYRADRMDMQPTLMATWSSVNSGYAHYSQMINHTINNINNTYWVEIEIPAGHALEAWTLEAVYQY